MIARYSDSIVGRLRRVREDEGGAIVVFVAVILVVVLAMAGLAIDLGRGYLVHARLGRAVDASALAAARSLRQGQGAALTNGTAVSEANGLVDGVDGVSTSFAFGTNADGENTITVSATKPLTTTFMRVLGHQQMRVGASATAAVPPVDLVLVLDQSGSLGTAGAWNDLQDAAKAFVQYFDDGIDRVGLVSYQIRGTDRFLIDYDFTSPITQSISLMLSAGDTNTGEGLRVADLQFASVQPRPRAARVLVFFTDGRPTAFRGNLAGRDRVMAVYTTAGQLRGYFDNPDQLPTDQAARATGCRNAGSCFGMNENAVRTRARVEGFQSARNLRRQNVLIYAIGLGNPSASNPLLVPDLNYLRDIANENGRVDPNEPQGAMFFAPTAADLQTVFNQVAQDLLVRLSS